MFCFEFVPVRFVLDLQWNDSLNFSAALAIRYLSAYFNQSKTNRSFDRNSFISQSYPELNIAIRLRTCFSRIDCCRRGFSRCARSPFSFDSIQKIVDVILADRASLVMIRMRRGLVRSCQWYESMGEIECWMRNIVSSVPDRWSMYLLGPASYMCCSCRSQRIVMRKSDEAFVCMVVTCEDRTFFRFDQRKSAVKTGGEKSQTIDIDSMIQTKMNNWLIKMTKKEKNENERLSHALIYRMYGWCIPNWASCLRQLSYQNCSKTDFKWTNVVVTCPIFPIQHATCWISSKNLVCSLYPFAKSWLAVR